MPELSLSAHQVGKLTDWFPNIEPTNCKLLSENDDRANCIGWAMGDARRWWWPVAPGGSLRRRHHWPDACRRSKDIDGFEALMEYVGGIETEDEKPEKGFVKVALFATGDLTLWPQHMARLLPSGKWLSKCGPYEAITHDLHEMEGGLYGEVIAIHKIPYQRWRELRHDTTAEQREKKKKMRAENEKLVAELEAPCSTV